ncbi:MAG: Response regulator PleD [Spirochaetes bacterium ADurb.Bin269]|nr:MAG: Response regulator PleD [Spirochaetes bacterium ADurb.Bin269]
MVRTYDLVGRFGGEEFIVVSPDSSGQDIAGMTERILDKVRRTVFAHEKQKMRFTFSGGIACSNEVSGDPPSVEELLALADKRLYEAKAEGRDRCKWT